MEQQQIVTSLSPIIPPNKDWPFIQYVSENGLFYFMASSNQEEYNPSITHQYVDKNAKIAVALVYNAGCKISACFAGSFYPTNEIKKLWNLIKTEERYIRKIGLQVRDSTSNKELLFLDPSYREPWGNLNKFQEYIESLICDYIGILVPVNMSDTIEKLDHGLNSSSIRVSKTENILRNNINYVLFDFEIRCSSKDLLIEEWRKLTEFFAVTFLKNSKQEV